MTTLWTGHLLSEILMYLYPDGWRDPSETTPRESRHLPNELTCHPQPVLSIVWLAQQRRLRLFQYKQGALLQIRDVCWQILQWIIPLQIYGEIGEIPCVFNRSILASAWSIATPIEEIVVQRLGPTLFEHIGVGKHMYLEVVLLHSGFPPLHSPSNTLGSLINVRGSKDYCWIVISEQTTSN